MSTIIHLVLNLYSGFCTRSMKTFSFLKLCYFTDETQFTQEGMVKLHNLHKRADENPRSALVHGHQRRFAVNIWPGIVGNYLLGP